VVGFVDSNLGSMVRKQVKLGGRCRSIFQIGIVGFVGDEVKGDGCHWRRPVNFGWASLNSWWSSPSKKWVVGHRWCHREELIV
jgi:hypothetical protein